MPKTSASPGLGLCQIGVPADENALPVAGTGRLSNVRKSKRSRWRAGVLIGVHALIALHITHYLIAGRSLSPVEPSESMYTLELGYVNAGFIFFAVALLGTLVFGRFFCGWGCHVVALQDFCAWIMKKLGIRPTPFRSRFLLFAPVAVALYMFVWPTVYRLSPWGADRGFPGFSNHLMTSALWATFPGPVFAVLTFAVCGFAAVYFLGAKGFCTYGCPYGAAFAALDYASPGRIVVSDACEQCGHCTVTCTSNVRVHDEVRRFGMVVDPGCMKCMDCVSVCPKGALSFSFAKPALFKKDAAPPRVKRYDLTLAEELFVMAIGLVTTLVYRDLYNGPPLLMSVGLGGITAFLALKLWRISRKSSVRVQNLELKSSGRITARGKVFVALTVLWLAFTSHSAFAQWHRAWGKYYLNHTEVTREDGLSGAFKTKPTSPSHEHALAESYRHFSLADRWGLVGVVEVKVGLAWHDVLSGDFEAAARHAQQAIDLAPERAELHQNLKDIRAAQQASTQQGTADAAAQHFAAANALAEEGRYEDAVREYEACLAGAPDSGPARFNFGGVLRRLGRNEAAIEQLTEARRLLPEDADVCVELGLAYMDIGDKAAAIGAFESAIQLNPDSPESKMYLQGLIEKLSH